MDKSFKELSKLCAFNCILSGGNRVKQVSVVCFIQFQAARELLELGLIDDTFWIAKPLKYFIGEGVYKLLCDQLLDLILNTTPFTMALQKSNSLIAFS